MNARHRFLKTMALDLLDHPPYFEEGLRPEVLEIWRRDPCFSPEALQRLGASDLRTEILPELEARPKPDVWPASEKDMALFKSRFDPSDPERLPDDWPRCTDQWKESGHVRMMRVHRGFFLSMGVYSWNRFHQLMDLVLDDPDFVRLCLDFHADFAMKMLQKVLASTSLEAVVFSEPIGGNHGPLISPDMYETLVLPSLVPILEEAKKAHIRWIVFRTYANARLLIPSILKFGFNCLWACEVNLEQMDYLTIRKEFGPELRLIGGIDLDVLRTDKESIKKEILSKVPPLLKDGGYIPIADGRVRPDVPFENYLYYRKLLKKVVEGEY